MKTEKTDGRCVPEFATAACGGFSLVEMMVAMTIGLVLAGAGIAVYSNSRAAYTVNESVSRLQENARYALEEITRDLRLAGYWGLNSSAALVQGQNSLTPANNDCSPQWYTNLSNRVEGSNDVNTGYALCVPAATYQAGTDILAMRFVDPTPVVALAANTPYLRSNRNSGRLFLGTAQPGGLADAQNYKLESRTYYVSPWTNTLGDGAPALKRVVLVPDAGNVALQEEVVVSGVENLQVQYALDVDGDRSVDRYVNGGAGVPWPQVEAVRLWLLVRAPTAEAGYTNTTTFQLPQAAVTPPDSFRRVLVTKTVHLHN
ncbi:MAG: PilW family protein [Gammaproteobacteria bacterium]